VSTFNNLIGKRINGIFLDKDNCTLMFRTTEGKYFGYGTSGDCCNSVWINHMTGINLVAPNDNSFDVLRGALVTATEDRGWTEDRGTDDDWGEVIQDGFWCITTDRGYIDIEVRNSHNGYYGGQLEEIDNVHLLSDIEGLKQIYEDF
jgi:hypothetical protein